MFANGQNGQGIYPLQCKVLEAKPYNYIDIDHDCIIQDAIYSPSWPIYMYLINKVTNSTHMHDYSSSTCPHAVYMAYATLGMLQPWALRFLNHMDPLDYSCNLFWQCGKYGFCTLNYSSNCLMTGTLEPSRCVFLTPLKESLS